MNSQEAAELRAEVERRYEEDPAFRARCQEVADAHVAAGGAWQARGWVETGAALAIAAYERGRLRL